MRRVTASFALLVLLAPLSSFAFESPPLAAEVDSLWNAGERPAALDLLATELPRARAAADSALLSNLLVRQGIFANFRGESRLAETSLTEAVDLARARGDSTLLISGVRWLSVAVGSQGRRDEAMVMYRELLDLGLALDDRRHQGWAHIGIAWVNWREGRTQLALEAYETAAALFPGTDDVEGELWANNGIATLNSNLGRFDEAAAGYLAVIEVARAHGQDTAEAVALNNLGTLEFSLGRADVALEHFERALELHTHLDNKRQQLSPLFNIALCQNNLGQTDAARSTLEEALSFCEEYGYQDHQSRALVKLAGLELQRKRLNKAAALIHEAMADPETMFLRDVVEARIELGEGFRLQGDYPAAAHQFAQADSLLGDTSSDWVRMRLMGYQGRILLNMEAPARAMDQFLGLVDFAETKGYPEFRMMALAEAGHTCQVTDRPDSARILFEEAAVAWETDRRLLLSPQWRERRGTSGRHIFTDLAGLIAAEGDLAEAFNRVQTYKGRTLLERMLGPGQAFADYMAGPDTLRATLADVQTRALGPGEILLDFTLGPRRSLLFAVTPDTVVMRRLPPAADIEARARAYYDLLKQPDAGSPAALAAVGAGLSDLLLSDLPTVFADRTRILLAPDGALNLLPFAEFELAGPARSWARVPSASILLKLRSEADPSTGEAPWRTLAVASGWGLEDARLPGTLREVDHLAGTYSRVETRTLGGEETDLPSLAGFDILHLAAHTSNDDQSPWQSAIHFLPDEATGRLRAADILNLDLDARLAVLSSCGSGTGKVLNGEGVLGLSSAFLGAGVPAVLASLWAVDDGATTRFMELYYGFLADGEDCAGALAGAQSVMRETAATGHPYYWAGFVLVGNGRLQPQLTRSPDYLVPGALGLLGASLLLVLIRRRS